jgi:hypothetical protein
VEIQSMSTIDTGAGDVAAGAADIPRFLPLLNREKNPAPHDDASWFRHTPGTGPLAEYATAMVIPPPRSAPERFKSIPSPWARLMLFQHALFSPTHPAHARIVSEWRGLLGCIALDGYLPLGLRAVDVTLPTDGRVVMGALREMAPGPDDPRWTRLALLSLGHRVVGGTSPHTLVFTGIRPVEAPVPFREGGRLIDPAAYYGARGDTTTLALLARWLRPLVEGPEAAAFRRDLLTFFGDQPDADEEDTRTHLILTRLQEWLADINALLRGLGGEPELPTELDTQPFKDLFPPPHPGASLFLRFRGIRRAGEAPPFVPDLRMRDGQHVLLPGFGGRIYQDDGRPFNGAVRLRPGFDAVVSDGVVETAVQASQLDGTVAPPLGELFESTMIAVEEVAETSAVALSAGARRFLFPFRPEVLQYLPAAALASCTSASGDLEAGFEVVLSIPVQRGLRMEWRRAYPPDAVVTRYFTPTLGVWPNFTAPDWNHHYYYVRLAAADRNLEVQPVVHGESAPEPVSRGPNRWGRLASPAAAWQGSADGRKGLLLALPPEAVGSGSEEWEVSIDFGSTHTRVFRAAHDVNGKPTVKAVELKPRACTLLGAPSEFPLRFFLAPENHVEQMVELRSLVMRGADASPPRKGAEWLPSDGVIFWQSLTGGLRHEGLRANLKWHENGSEDQQAFRSYITQLLLSVAAEAVAGNARLKSVATAYPSVFPSYLYNSHLAEWRALLKELGVKHVAPVPESSAVATYLVRKRGGKVTSNLISVDVGGSTADLAVWAGTKVRSTDSVRFAGGLVGSLVATDTGVREELERAAESVLLRGTAAFAWEEGPFNSLIFNALLRAVSQREGPEGARRLAEAVYGGGPGRPGERLIAHAGYLFAALSYLAGLMVRRAGLQHTDYDLYFAGRGAEFLPWLEVLRTDASSTIPRVFFSAALSTPDTVPSPDDAGVRGRRAAAVPGPAVAAPLPNVNVHLPENDAKLEVGQGLLLKPLGGDRPSPERLSFVGETGFEDAKGPVRWTDPLTFGSLKALRMPERTLGPGDLLLLRGFVTAFAATPETRLLGDALGISADSVTTHVASRVVERIFGDRSPWARAQTTREVDDHALLEPFFVTGAKVLLEEVTRNPDLFQDG